MKKIEATKGMVVLVSDVDYPFLSAYTWQDGGRGYAKHTTLGLMQRVVLERMLGSKIPKGMEVDHINRKKYDNRRENLRLATHSENQVNSSAKIGISGFRGVSIEKNNKTKIWKANITYHGKKERLGSFLTKEEAALAYNKRAKELFGDFAYLNLIKSKIQ